MSKKLVFRGYWVDSASGIPDKPGIYCVYRGIDNGDTCRIKQLLYIGESKEVKTRISGHKKKPIWRGYLNSEEDLFYSFAQTNTVSEENAQTKSVRQDYESQLLYDNDPPTNTNVPENDPNVSVTHTGKNKFLS